MDQFDILKYVNVPNRIIYNLRKVYYELPDPSSYYEKSLYIYGDVGSGKTIFAAHVLLHSINNYPKNTIEYILNRVDRSRNNEWYDPEYVPSMKYWFCKMLSLFNSIKKTFAKDYEGESESKIVDKCIKAQLLVIDDLGIEITNDWSRQNLHYIIGSRYDNMSPTIFTSNLSLLDLSDKLQDSRIPSRIVEMCEGNILELGNIDKRIK